MSRALRINTVVESESTYDTNSIKVITELVAKLESLVKEQPSEGVKKELERFRQQLQQEESDKITWLIGILPSDIYKASLRVKTGPVSTNSKSVEVTSSSDEIMTNLVLAGLKGWKNFKDADGNPIEFKTVRGIVNGLEMDIVSPDLMTLIPWEHQIDIANKVRQHNTVSGIHLKN